MADEVSMRIFGAPRRYVQGPGLLGRLGPEIEALGRSALMVIDPAVKRIVEPTVSASLAASGVGLVVAVFGGEVTSAEIARLADAAAHRRVDVVLAAGGGKTIDAGKAVGARLNCDVVSIPTAASSDAPTSHIYVVYDESHRLLSVERMPRGSPALVAVDSAVIAAAPPALLLAGIGDAVSKKFEVRQCRGSKGMNIFKGASTIASVALADCCFDTILKHGAAALRSAGTGVVSEAFENTLEATILLSGLGFESGGLSIAHSMTRGLSDHPQTASVAHGLQVAYGTIVQLVLERGQDDLLSRLISFYAEIGLPMSLRALGLTAAQNDDFALIADGTMRSPHIGNFMQVVNRDRLIEAMKQIERGLSCP